MEATETPPEKKPKKKELQDLQSEPKVPKPHVDDAKGESAKPLKVAKTAAKGKPKARKQRVESQKELESVGPKDAEPPQVQQPAKTEPPAKVEPKAEPHEETARACIEAVRRCNTSEINMTEKAAQEQDAHAADDASDDAKIDPEQVDRVRRAREAHARYMRFSRSLKGA